MSINPLTGCARSPRVLWAEILVDGQVCLIILTSLGRSLALQSTSDGETRWVWASLAGVWQESQSQKGASLLLDLSQRQKWRKALPALGHHSLTQHRRSLVPTLHPPLCWLQCWRKAWCFPYPNSWGSCFSIMSLPGSLFPWVHLAPVRNTPGAAPPGQEPPDAAAASQPKAHQGRARTKRHRWAESCTGTAQL